jgi:hypothetical protein
VAPDLAEKDLAEKEAKQIWRRRRMVLGGERWWRRMVLGGGTTDVVRMVWERQHGELMSISESMRT